MWESPEEEPHETTLSDIMAETMVNWGSIQYSGWWDTPTWDWRMPSEGKRKKGSSNSSGSGMREPAHLPHSAYGKLTGKPAACFSIAGPGATNMFTGLWDAKG